MEIIGKKFKKKYEKKALGPGRELNYRYLNVERNTPVRGEKQVEIKNKTKQRVRAVIGGWRESLTGVPTNPIEGVFTERGRRCAGVFRPVQTCPDTLGLVGLLIPLSASCWWNVLIP